jgi:ATP-binding protein involved in chromosome partitioning
MEINTWTENKVLQCLGPIDIPQYGKSIVELGYVQNLKIQDSSVEVRLEIPVGIRHIKDKLHKRVYQAVSQLGKELGSNSEIFVSVGFQIQKATPENKAPSQPNSAAKPSLSGVKQILAIASGKGGVGKSTVTANLAKALSQTGAKVGVMDTDIYGPSMSMMFDIREAPSVTPEKKLVPVEVGGIKVVSMAMLSDADSALIWRGPMVSQMVQNFLNNVIWGELDYLLIDMPPGTGDIQLTLTQSATITGAFIVTTPQDVSVLDAKKGLKMFQKVSVPVLGIIENMSYFICGSCGTRHHILQEGGGKRVARSLGVPFAGEIPMEREVSRAGDVGNPVVASNPDTAAAKVFETLAQKAIHQLEEISKQEKTLGTYDLEWEQVEHAVGFVRSGNNTSEDSTLTHYASPLSFKRGGQGGRESLVVEWKGGFKYDYNLFELRLSCPCAKCVDEWTGVRTLKRDSIPEDIQPKKLFSVGQYALGIEWSDGHNSGIYSYDYLYQLSQEIESH